MHGCCKLGLARIGLIGAAEHIGIDDRRAHGIDADFLLGILDGRRFGQANDGMLGSTVDTHLRRGTQAGDRRGVNDGATALGQQQRQLVLHAQPHTFDVYAHDGVELSFAAIRQTPLLNLDTGIVEGIVETTVSLERSGHQMLHIGFASNVAGYEQRLCTRRPDQLDRALTPDCVQIRYHHLQTLGGKRQGCRPPDTCRTAGHQGNLAGKSHAHR
ncbi:hypothetical protein D3C77_535510 [compost metagenome]